jgi:hypothetical protein
MPSPEPTASARNGGYQADCGGSASGLRLTVRHFLFSHGGKRQPDGQRLPFSQDSGPPVSPLAGLERKCFSPARPGSGRCLEQFPDVVNAERFNHRHDAFQSTGRDLGQPRLLDRCDRRGPYFHYVVLTLGQLAFPGLDRGQFGVQRLCIAHSFLIRLIGL